MVISHPHFYLGDAALREPFEGLNPNELDHGMIADYHKQLGVLIGGQSRFQINFLVQGSSVDPGIEKDIILPILWVQEHYAPFPPHFVRFLHFFSFATTKLHVILRYLSLIIAAVSYLSLMVIIMRKKRKFEGRRKMNVTKNFIIFKQKMKKINLKN